MTHQESENNQYLQEAFNEEQQLLNQAVQQAQLQHLMSRAVDLNAQLRQYLAQEAQGESGINQE